MRVAVIENNEVVNVAVFDALPEDWPQELIPLSELPVNCWIGWRWEDGGWVDPNQEIAND